MSLNRLITRRCTLSSMASAVAKTDRARLTVGSTGPVWHESSWAGRLFLRFKKCAEQLAVRTRAVRVMLRPPRREELAG